MNNNYTVMVVLFGSLISLIGTMIGASMGIMVKKPSNKLLGAIVGFAGGLMLSVVVFDLIPESITHWGPGRTIFFCIIGVITIIYMDRKVSLKGLNQHMKVAVMTALGLMIHNFPEGIIMGCGFATGGSLGLKMSLVIAIHDIPEGISVSAPLMASKVKAGRILLYAFLTAFPTAIGAFLGAYIGSVSKDILGACLALASGIMLFVVCGEMMPESNKLWDGLTSTLGMLGGILSGLVIIQFL